MMKLDELNNELDRNMRAACRCVLMRIIRTGRGRDERGSPTGFTMVPDHLIRLGCAALYWEIDASFDAEDGGHRVQDTIDGIEAMIAADKVEEAE